MRQPPPNVPLLNLRPSSFALSQRGEESSSESLQVKRARGKDLTFWASKGICESEHGSHVALPAPVPPPLGFSTEKPVWCECKPCLSAAQVGNWSYCILHIAPVIYSKIWDVEINRHFSAVADWTRSHTDKIRVQELNAFSVQKWLCWGHTVSCGLLLWFWRFRKIFSVLLMVELSCSVCYYDMPLHRNKWAKSISVMLYTEHTEGKLHWFQGNLEVDTIWNSADGVVFLHPSSSYSPNL